MTEYRIYAVPKGAVWHKIFDLGNGWATHNGPDSNIVIGLLHEALAGKKYFLERSVSSAMSPETMLNRALALSQKRRYSLAYNCEDYIEELLGNPPESPQRNACLALISIGAA